MTSEKAPVETENLHKLPIVQKRKRARRDYLLDIGNLMQLCRKYGVSDKSMCKWAKQGDWRQLRDRVRDAEVRELVKEPVIVPAFSGIDSGKANEITENEALRARLRKKMNESDDPNELRDLSMAYDRLFQAWCVLTGTARPAPVKREAKPKSASSEVASPSPALQDEAAPDLKPIEPEYSPL